MSIQVNNRHQGWNQSNITPHTEKKSSHPFVNCNWPPKAIQFCFHLFNTFVYQSNDTWYFCFYYRFQMLHMKPLIYIQRFMILKPMKSFITVLPRVGYTCKTRLTNTKKGHLREKFCKIYWTHFTSQVSIIRTRIKVLLFPSSSINHISVLHYISLGSIHNPHPWMLQTISSAFKNL